MCAALRAVDVPVSPVNTYAEAATDSQVRERGMLVDEVLAELGYSPERIEALRSDGVC